MTKNNNNKVKLNLSISPEVKDYLTSNSECFGMSVSAYITMIVQQYRQQAQALSEMSKIQGYIEQFQALVDNKK